MARVKNNCDYNNPFAVRLRELIDEKGVKHREVAENIGVTRQTVGQYADGTTLPTLDKLLKMAEYFDVPLDYIAGTGKAKSKNADIAAVCDYLGLNEKAILSMKKEIDLIIAHEVVLGERDASDALKTLECFLCNSDRPLQTIVRIIEDIRLCNDTKTFLSCDFLERYKDSSVAQSMAADRLKIEEFNASRILFELCNVTADKLPCLLTSQELSVLEKSNTVAEVYNQSKTLSYYPLQAEIEFYYSALLEKAILEEKKESNLRNEE